eukprot:1773003-Amphidinium_carterae.1
MSRMRIGWRFCEKGSFALRPHVQEARCSRQRSYWSLICRPWQACSSIGICQTLRIVRSRVKTCCSFVHTARCACTLLHHMPIGEQLL